MGDGSDNSITSLVEYATQEEFDKPDLTVALEIADRANQSKKECQELVQALIKTMKKSNKQVVLNTVLLIDTLTKNCDMRFHYEIARKDFCEGLLKLLKRKRQKAGFLTKMMASNDERIDEIETKVLYLIQLWADTFMMHEDEFKPVQEAYRLLRKEGVKFPPRDPNEKFMIKFKGTVSPVFETGELNQNPNNPQANVESKTPSTSEKKPSGVLSKPTNSKPRHKQNKHQYNDYDEEDDMDVNALGNAHVSYEEIKIIKSTVSVLNDIRDNAVNPQQMKTETAREILNELVQIQKKLAIIIQIENFKDDLERMNCLDLNDAINDAVSTYHDRYNQLKKMIYNGELPISLSEMKSIDGTKGKQPKEEPKEKKMAHATHIAKTDSKLGKLAPPTGWKDPNTGNKQSAQNFINLLDMDDEEERQGVQQQQQPEPVTKAVSLDQPTNEFVSKPKKTKSAQETEPQVINVKVNQQVDLLDMEDDVTANKDIKQPEMAGNATGTNPSTIRPIVTKENRLFGDPHAGNGPILSYDFSQVNNQQQANPTPLKTEDDDDDFFSSIANRKKET